MINEIRIIVQNYLKNAKLCGLIVGTVTSDGIKIGDTKPPIPMDLIMGNLRTFISVGDKVKLIRNHGGQEFYIVEIIGAIPVLKGMELSIEPITISIPDGGGSVTISSIKINEVSL